MAREAPAINPAWSYRTVGYGDFTPLPLNNPWPALTVDGNGLHSGTHVILRSPLWLPQGAVVQEVTFWVYNASPNTELPVGLAVQTPPSTFIAANFTYTNLGAGAHTVTLSAETTSFIRSPIDNTQSGYALYAVLTDGATHGLSGARIGYTNGHLLTTVTPVRKLDTRGGAKIRGGQRRTVLLGPELPPGWAKAAAVNVTVMGTEGAGSLALYPAGTANPGTPAMNWTARNATLTNSTTVAVSPTGRITVRVGGRRSAKAHVLVDLVGYYA